jgi:thiol-disulfide isomerase/thioredoxin
MKALLPLAILLLSVTFSFAQNEQSPIVEKDITYKNWKYKSVRDDQELELRKLVAGNKLVAVVYFAPWCPNWRHDAPMLERLYEKYHSAGFEILAVGEYDSAANAKINIDSMKLTFPMVYESQDRADREKTHHYDYRQTTGDTRKWGSPWYVFIEPVSIEKKGDTILKHTHIINGEMIEVEGEKFIREKLGLPPLDQKTATTKPGEVEVCDPNQKKTTELKKP